MEKQFDSMQVVIFQLGDEEYGIPILAVQEIIRPQVPTKIPKAPQFIKGIINLRGQVIPIVDLAGRFGLTAATTTQEQRFVVVEVEGNTVGIIVDSVSEVLAVSGENIKPPMEGFQSFDTKFISGILTLEERLIILLDIEKLFKEDELLALQEAVEEA